MRVLVTGGGGFIGAALVRAAVGAGHEVHVLDTVLGERPRTKRSGGSPDDGPTPGSQYAAATWSRVDVRDRPAVEAVLAMGFDAVFHLAAKVGLGVSLADLPDYASHNDVGTAVLLSAMAHPRVDRLVVASSMVVYGEGHSRCRRHGVVLPGPRSREDLDAGRFEPRCPGCSGPVTPVAIDETAPLSPRNGYAASKVAQEHLATAWAIATGGRAVALRYHNVYGPGLPRDTPYAGVAAIFGSALARGEPPRVFEDGGQRRDFVHVEDVARANLAALDALSELPPGRLHAYNVASGQPHTVGELAHTLAAARGGPDPLVTGEYRAGDVRHVVASAQRAEAELGFRAQVTFADGVKALAKQWERPNPDHAPG